MVAEKLTQLLRCGALALFSILLASCGSGDGKDSVDASDADAEASELRLVFKDDFGGPAVAAKIAGKTPPAALPPGNWVVETGYGNEADAPGWGNDEWQLYQNSMDNLFTEDGSLVIRAKCATAPVCGKRNGEITSARIITKDRLNVRYGNIRARIKMPSGKGMWPAFWTLGSDIDENPWPDAGEIDIVEMHYYYSDTRTTHFSTHWGGPRYDSTNRPDCSSGVDAASPDEEENCITKNKTFDKSFDDPLTDDFHVYELDWSENTIVGKIDGITYFSQGIDPDTMEEFLKDHFLLLNVAVGGTLGGPPGPSMSAADWANPDQTDMLVDWVEVYEKVPPSTATLIDESGNNLDYNRIINTAEFGGGFVKTDLDSTAVTPLVGSTVLEVNYSNSISEFGGVPAAFSGAVFQFNGIDLSNFNKVAFSLDASQVAELDEFYLELQDSRFNGVDNFAGQVLVPLSNYPPVAVDGNWLTLEIPLSDFVGVNINDVDAVAFSNPRDEFGNLLSGTLYLDDIRFVAETCAPNPTVSFDGNPNYNPATRLAELTVTDACAAASLAVVKVENGENEEIFVGVELDAAGNGSTVFDLLPADSVCSTSDEFSYIKLSTSLMATYTTATAMAGIDPSAPGSMLTGERSYFYTTDPDQPLAFLPDAPGANGFNYDVFGSGSTLNGAFSDAPFFDPVFEVQSGPGYGAEVAQIALINIAAGFAADAETINFKFKNQGSPNNAVTIEFGILGGAGTAVVVNLLDTTRSTDIGDDWYAVSVPMTDFPDVDNYNFMAFTSADPAPPVGSTFTFLITDIFLSERAGNAPAECEDVVEPPIEGSGTGATGATGGPYSVSFDDSAVTYGFTGFGMPDTVSAIGADPVDAGNLVAQTTKPVGSQVWAGVTVETTPGITWPVSVTESEITIRIYSPGPGLVVRMKLEESATAANFVEAEAVATVTTGWETLTFDFANPVDGAINPAFAYDKLSLFFGFGTSGDGTTYTWDTIEFQDAGGGTASGGSVPDVTIYEADGSEADLSPGYDPFGSGTGIATVADTSYTQALELTIANGYGPSLAQLGLTGLSFTGYDEFLFKVKGLTADNTIRVTAEASGGGSITIDLTSAPSGVTATDLGDGWTQVVIALTAFGDVSSASQVVFQTLDNAYPVGDTFLLTDIGFNIAGGGTASGGSVPDVTIYEADGSEADLSPGYDPFGSGTGIATVADTSYTQALELTIANGYGPSLAQLGLTGLSFTGYDEFLFKVKGLTTDNTIRVTAEASGGGSITIDLTSAPSGVTATDLGDGWTQVVIALTAFGDVSSASQVVFQTLDNAYPVGDTFLLTDIGFNNAGGGTASGGSVPDVTIYEADGSEADLSPGYDPFGSGTGIATVADTSYTQALELTIANGYGPSLAQLGLTGLSFTGYDEFLFKVKGLTADNTIRVTAEASGGGSITIDLTSAPSGVTATDLGDGWTQVVIALTAFGDVSSASQVVFQTLDNAYPVGDTFLLTDIGFNNAGGGGGDPGLPLDVNGGFEAGDGDLSDWVVVPNGGTIVSVDTQDSGSVWSVKLAADGSGGSPYISQAGLGAAEVMPGDNVYVSFDMCGTLEGDGGAIKIALLSEKGEGNGSDRATLEEFVGSPPASVWTRYEYTTQASANVTDGVSLQLEAACGAVAGCGVNAYFDNVSIILGGDPPASQTASGASCAAPPAPGVMLPIDFEDGPYTFGDFGGGQASVEANSQSGGINVSANVGKMLKFAGEVFGGSTFDLGGTLTVPANSTFVMKVWSSRPVPVLFKLEGGPAAEVTANHAGGSVWEELTFDFTGLTTGDHNGITLIFDNGVAGEAATDPGNWTFYFDDIDFAPAPPAPNVTLFADAFAPGWVGFLDATGTVTVVTDSDSTYGEVLEITTGGNTVVGLGSRAAIGGDGVNIDTSRFAVLEFDLKLVTAPTSGTTNWRLKTENPGVEIGIDAPVLDTWVRYSIPISDLGTPDALDLIMLFPDYGANAGAVYRLDNVKLLEEASPPPPEDITLFADALATGWVGFLDATGTVTVVTDSDATYGEVLEITTGGNTVVGIGSRAAIGGDGVNIDTSDFATLEFDLKLVTAPTSGTTNWRFKTENPGQEIGIDAPVLDTWVHYSIPISSLGTPDALDLIMLFPDYGLNAGAVYRLDNVMLLVGDGGGGGGGGGGSAVAINGDFETGDFTGWTLVSAGSSTVPSSIDIDTSNPGTNPDSGSVYTARLQAAGNTGGTQDALLQQVALGAGSVAVGDTINVSFDLYGEIPGPGGVVFVELIYLDSAGNDIGNRDFIDAAAPYFPNNSWTTYTGSKAARINVDGGVTLQIKASCGDVPACTVDAYVDNVTFEIVP